MKRLARAEVEDARSDNELTSGSELFERLLDIAEEERLADDFELFIEFFRRGEEGELPRPIKNLIEWRRTYPDKIYVVRTAENHLELWIDRVALVVHHVDTPIMQNFERCLMSVKPALIVLQTTHNRKVSAKRYGFQDCQKVFGSPRINIGRKEQRYWSRRSSKLRRIAVK